ncbi:PAS domain S-box-containing protein/diguanylate cyclase (GGDEF)-like protein [Natranaerovirga hydrolytica]|uniref:PAS domain S-box-containing protein/diguanylate cyclase (GGDEF)-like protein n=1 Tax=Natranaerovirga hydrolytica TaxID=680378 RepID=A0A4R1MIL9_9FIRM|nr:HD domain-containing phosphohydrolase [Natranaerovirga hydrolytica]TCK92568.1 PAS domain S-box-containing protein/diguanylate cyclase (GGDEF)-like protein [Natranaerovirga hydrolytica]
MTDGNLRVIFDSLYDAIIIHDLSGRILDVNKKMLSMYNIPYEAIDNLTIEEDLSASDNPFEKLPIIWKEVINGHEHFFEWKAKSYDNKKIFDVEVILTRISLQYQDVILATIRDISERKKTEKVIRQLSYHDKLTGLYNRAFFEKELQRLDNERHLPLSIIIGDVNGLKLTNDAFGHLEGDALLKRVAEVLKMATRKEDIIARWGGDEFAIIMPNTELKTAAKTCQRIKSNSLKVKSEPIPVSIGLGYAAKVVENQDIFDIIKDAETHMYSNKLKEGRNNRRQIINDLLERQVMLSDDLKYLTDVCLQLGKAYGLKDSELEKLKLLAQVHDIGKVAISKEIISKLGTLTDEEWIMVRKHSVVGYRILSTYPEYAHISNDVLTHHERWDGKGYPRGLKGEEIPILARILAIADAYEVIISGRPYRKARTHEQALKEIEDNSGTQFDPTVVKLFLNLMRK